MAKTTILTHHNSGSYGIILSYKGDKKAEHHGEQQQLGMDEQVRKVFISWDFYGHYPAVNIVPPIPMVDLDTISKQTDGFTDMAEKWARFLDDRPEGKAAIYHRSYKPSDEDMARVGEFVVGGLNQLGYVATLVSGDEAPTAERGLHV